MPATHGVFVLQNWYPGRIIRKRINGTYDVAYDAGGEENVPLSWMRPRESSIRLASMTGSLRSEESAAAAATDSILPPLQDDKYSAWDGVTAWKSALTNKQASSTGRCQTAS